MWSTKISDRARSKPLSEVHNYKVEGIHQKGYWSIWGIWILFILVKLWVWDKTLYETHMRFLSEWLSIQNKYQSYIRFRWEWFAAESRWDLYEIHMWFIWDLEGSDYRRRITWLYDESRKGNSRIIIVGICPRGRVNDISQYHSWHFRPGDSTTLPICWSFIIVTK